MIAMTLDLALWHRHTDIQIALCNTVSSTRDSSTVMKSASCFVGSTNFEMLASRRAMNGTLNVFVSVFTVQSRPIEMIQHLAEILCYSSVVVDEVLCYSPITKFRESSQRRLFYCWIDLPKHLFSFLSPNATWAQIHCFSILHFCPRAIPELQYASHNPFRCYGVPFRRE